MIAYRLTLFLILALWGAPFVAGATLDDVKARGFVRCGVSQGVPGFSIPNANNRWIGFDADYCRAIAAAIFGSGNKVEFTPLSTTQRFTALQSGEVDVLARNTVITGVRDTSLGVDSAAVHFHDGQTAMVRKSLNIKSFARLGGASFCVLVGSQQELNLARYFSARKLQYSPVMFANFSEAVSAYRNGRCDGLSGDATQLASERLKFSNPTAHIIMPEIISREALSLLVREGDQQWREVVTWVHNALLIAEFHGITSSNAANASLHDDPEARRLFGFDPQGIGTNLGLSAAWARNAIRAVGNYAQVYNRNLGANSAFKLPRGVNALFVNGGLHFPPPL